MHHHVVMQEKHDEERVQLKLENVRLDIVSST